MTRKVFMTKSFTRLCSVRNICNLKTAMENKLENVQENIVVKLWDGEVTVSN